MVYPDDNQNESSITQAVQVKGQVGIKFVFDRPNAQYFQNKDQKKSRKVKENGMLQRPIEHKGWFVLGKGTICFYEFS